MTAHFPQIGPPSSNRGVPGAQPPTQTPSLDPSTCPRFDWYQATVHGQPDPILQAFVQHFGGSFRPAGGLYSFTTSAIHDSLGLRIFWGGQNPGAHIQGTSYDAAPVAEFIRERWPSHLVSRADVCWDFSFPGGFETLRDVIEPIARKARAAVCLVGDPNPATNKGQTLYFGSRKSSDLFIRLYQKGLERRAAGVKDADPNWVRLEVVVRPRKRRKVDAATLPPEAFVGFSKWASLAVSEALGIAVPFRPDQTLRAGGDDAAFQHLCRQYGRLLRERVERDGWPALQSAMYREIYTIRDRQKMESRHL